MATNFHSPSLYYADHYVVNYEERATTIHKLRASNIIVDNFSPFELQVDITHGNLTKALRQAKAIQNILEKLTKFPTRKIFLEVVQELNAFIHKSARKNHHDFDFRFVHKADKNLYLKLQIQWQEKHDYLVMVKDEQNV